MTNTPTPAPRPMAGQTWVRQGYTYPAGAITIDRTSEAGDHIHFSPQGGGFIRSMAIATFLQLYVYRSPKSAPPAWYRARFTIDGLDQNRGGSVEGWTNGHRWNGWQCPAFPLDTIRAICADLDIPITHEGTTVVIHPPECDAMELLDITIPRAEGGPLTLYQFDGWCWDEVKPEAE